MKTTQEQFWTGEFGNDYAQRHRNPAVGSVVSNLPFFERALRRTYFNTATPGNPFSGGRIYPDTHIKTLIEFGAGTGLNLMALMALLPHAKQTAVEINGEAIKAVPVAVQSVIQGSMLDPHLGESLSTDGYDLAFTKGVLIHIAAQDLPAAYAALYRASRRYILLAEYFCPTRRMIPYRGHDDVLWADDFAGHMLTYFPDLHLIDYGFVSRRDPAPQDNLTWWLLEKRT